MARRPIHIHIHAPTQDNAAWSEAKHPRAPDGKFGHGGSSATTANRTAGKRKAGSVKLAQLQAHKQWSKEDYDYLHGEKGWSNEEILERWEAEGAQHQAPGRGKGPKPPDVVGYIAGRIDGNGHPIKK